MLPINHLKRTLDRCCGQWEFLEQPEPQGFSVLFCNTSRKYCIAFEYEQWSVHEWVGSSLQWNEFLSSRLNGLTRDDAGNPLPSDFDCVPGVE